MQRELTVYGMDCTFDQDQDGNLYLSRIDRISDYKKFLEFLIQTNVVDRIEEEATLNMLKN